MTLAERRAVESNAGDLFIALEHPVELLSYITTVYMTPETQYGPAEIDTLYAMLNLIEAQLYDVLTEYDMIMGRTERGATRHRLQLAAGAEPAAQHNKLHQRFSLFANDREYSPAVQEKAQQARSAAMRLPDTEAVKLLEKTLQEIEADQRQ